jgi:hypothetical protein
MNQVKHNDKDEGAGMSSLRYTPGQETSCTISKSVTHEEEGVFVQPNEQLNVFVRESTEPQDVKDGSVIHGIEGVCEVQVQHNREALGSALGVQEALQFA